MLPTDANASEPRVRPTMIVSTAEYSCWNTFPARIGSVNIKIVWKTSPFVKSYFLSNFFFQTFPSILPCCYYICPFWHCQHCKKVKFYFLTMFLSTDSFDYEKISRNALSRPGWFLSFYSFSLYTDIGQLLLSSRSMSPLSYLALNSMLMSRISFLPSM